MWTVAMSRCSVQVRLVDLLRLTAVLLHQHTSSGLYMSRRGTVCLGYFVQLLHFCCCCLYAYTLWSGGMLKLCTTKHLPQALQYQGLAHDWLQDVSTCPDVGSHSAFCCSSRHSSLPRRCSYPSFVKSNCCRACIGWSSCHSHQ